MNKKDFILGLLTGFVLAITFSFFLSNYYLDKKVEATKIEAQKQYAVLKEKIETQYQGEIAELKQYIKAKAAEKSTALVDNVSNKVKEYWNKEEPAQDSLIATD
ncbi:MAG: hypothetical protein ACRBFS_16580 [Aureispira sp.]